MDLCLNTERWDRGPSQGDKYYLETDSSAYWMSGERKSLVSGSAVALGINEDEIRALKSERRKRALRAAIGSAIAVLVSSLLGYFLGESYRKTSGGSGYPLAAAILMTTLPSRSEMFRSVAIRERKPLSLVGIAILVIAALSFVAGFIIGQSDEPVNGYSTLYNVAYRNHR